MKETMTKMERFSTVLSGRAADHPPITAWQHFVGWEHKQPKEFAQKLIEFQHRYDWDYLKVNTRAVYYHEAWGNEYDYSRYEDVLPTRTKTLINDPKDLRMIQPISGVGGVFGEQIELAKILVEKIGREVPLFMTVFTPIGIMLNLCGMRSIGRYRDAPRESSPLIQLVHEHGPQVHQALEAITQTLCEYCTALVKENIYGMFYAGLGMARSGYFTREEWEEFVRPYDLRILNAIRPAKTIFHTCGIHGNPEWFTDFPIDILHWAESATGNPPLAGSDAWLNGIIPMGGVDERPFGQDKPEEIAALARASIAKMAGKPFLLSPDCSVSVNTLDREYAAFRATVDES